jgi:hypothetical protein
MRSRSSVRAVLAAEAACPPPPGVPLHIPSLLLRWVTSRRDGIASLPRQSAKGYMRCAVLEVDRCHTRFTFPEDVYRLRARASLRGACVTLCLERSQRSVSTGAVRGGDPARALSLHARHPHPPPSATATTYPSLARLDRPAQSPRGALTVDWVGGGAASSAPSNSIRSVNLALQTVYLSRVVTRRRAEL